MAYPIDDTTTALNQWWNPYNPLPQRWTYPIYPDNSALVEAVEALTEEVRLLRKLVAGKPDYTNLHGADIHGPRKKRRAA